MHKLFVTCAWTTLAGSLSGCGGGAQLSPPPAPATAPSTTPPPATSSTSENFNTQEYEFSTSAKFSNAIGAWQAGATGRGIKVGIVDSGIVTNNPEFAGRIDPASRDIGGSGSLQDTFGHGTAIASVVAAARDNSTLEGVAPDATLVVMNVAGGNCSGGCSFDHSDIARGIDAAASAGARVINLSIGGNSDSGVVDAVQRAARLGVIFVIAAGNDGSANPSDFASSIANAAGGRAIIVGALGSPTGADIDYYRGTGIDYNQRWSDTNNAGRFAAWFLSAPGFGVRVAYQTDGVDVIRGTSIAAPAVAGAVALLLQAFPNLTPQEVVQILLTTGDDIGQAGADSIYGHGRLNVGRAFQPIGQTVLAGASKVTVSTVDNGSAPAAAGDALQRGSFQTVVLDAYKRAFSINLARTLQAPARQRPLAMALSGGSSNLSLNAGPFSFSGTVSDGIAGRNLGFASLDVGPNGQAPSLSGVALVSKLGRRSFVGLSTSGGAAALLRRLDGSARRIFLVNQDSLSDSSFNGRSGTSVAFRHRLGWLAASGSYEHGDISRSYAGERKSAYSLTSVGVDASSSNGRLGIWISRLEEKDTVLGGRLGSVFGSPGADTYFLDAEARQSLPRGWSVSAQARRGWTRFAGGDFTTGSYFVAIDKTGVWRSKDLLSLSFSQPLRVDSGGFRMTLPSSYDYGAGAPAYALTRMGLTPTGREMVGELAYWRPLPFGSAGINIYGRRQPGHYAEAASDLGGALQFKLGL